MLRLTHCLILGILVLTTEAGGAKSVHQKRIWIVNETPNRIVQLTIWNATDTPEENVPSTIELLDTSLVSSAINPWSQVVAYVDGHECLFRFTAIDDTGRFIQHEMNICKEPPKWVITPLSYLA